MRFCATQLAPIEAASKSDPYKRYVVTLHPAGSQHPSCTCMAWVMSRNRARKGLDTVNADVPGTCKHLTAALASTCSWSGESDGPCPRCGGPTVAAGTPPPLAVKAPEGPPPTIGMAELRPMLSEEIAAARLVDYTADDGFWFQQKLDGHRVLLHVQGGHVTALGRGGQRSQHGARFAQPAYADIARLPDCVIDGELIGDVFWIFDLPHAGPITINSAYRDRQAALEGLFAAWAPDPAAYRLVPTAKDRLAKATLAADLFRFRAEGVMIKDVTGLYIPGGRVRHVLKAKFLKEIDAWVSAVGDGKDNYSLSVYRDGEAVEVGRCSSIGKQACTVGDVVTVRFLYLAVNDRLFEPRMMAKRTDKTQAECTWEQLAGAEVNKEVLA